MQRLTHVHGVILEKERELALSFDTYNIELFPRRCDHVVDLSAFLIGPVLSHFPQVKAVDDLVRIHQCVHVGVKSVGCVCSFYVEFDLDKVVRVSTDDKIHIIPV